MDTVKPFLSIDDQIKLLKKRKLTIRDAQYEKAKEFLLNNNYYRIIVIRSLKTYCIALPFSGIFVRTVDVYIIVYLLESLGFQKRKKAFSESKTAI